MKRKLILLGLMVAALVITSGMMDSPDNLNKAVSIIDRKPTTLAKTLGDTLRFTKNQ